MTIQHSVVSQSQYSLHRYRPGLMAEYHNIGMTVVKILARLCRGNVRFLAGLKIAKRARGPSCRAGRSIDDAAVAAAAAARPWETERSISGGGDLVINLAGRSICSGRKNSICRVNTLCNGQRDICCRIVCPAAFLISLFIALKNERTITNVTSRGSGIQDRTYFPFFSLSSSFRVWALGTPSNRQASSRSNCIVIAELASSLSCDWTIQREEGKKWIRNLLSPFYIYDVN